MAEHTIRKSPRGSVAVGGSVSYEVHLDGRWVGWVGDERRWLGHTHGGRRWWAVHREAGDTGARWNSFGEPGGYQTRARAVAALVEKAGASSALV